MKRVMNVAQKPSAAKQIASILSKGNYTTVMSKEEFNPEYEFNYILRGQEVLMSFTSVTGHITSLEFEEKYSKDWESTPEEDLFKIPKVITKVNEDKQLLVQNLQDLAKNSFAVILWLDCDHEGEAIAFEVLQVCKDINPKIESHRALFSAFTEGEISEAITTLVPLNQNFADAVASRQEVDLRISAVFTRYLTSLLKKKFPELANEKVIRLSILRVLDLVEERWRKIQNFVAEPFWKICVSHEKMSNDGTIESVDFTWDRNSILDKFSAENLYEKCLKNPEAVVVPIKGYPKLKLRPFPLSTVQLLRLGVSKLGLKSNHVMSIAEQLYYKGFISYPRTETSNFPKKINVMGLVSLQKQHPVWGQYAYDLIENGKFQWPKEGKINDAHPPIHPVKLATEEHHGLTQDEWKVYELVTRHFLACCSKDALGFQTEVKIEIENEFFSATELTVKERNWLDIYPYDAWKEKKLLLFEVGEKFCLKKIWLNQSETKPPKLITESELIAMMDVNGVWMNSSTKEFIETALDWQYIEKEGIYFKPTKLGLALVEIFEETGTSLCKSFLATMMELNITRIARGDLRKEEFLCEFLDEIEKMFRELKEKEEVVLQKRKK